MHLEARHNNAMDMQMFELFRKVRQYYIKQSTEAHLQAHTYTHKTSSFVRDMQINYMSGTDVIKDTVNQTNNYCIKDVASVTA